MDLKIDQFSSDFDSSFKIFHELMAKKVRKILLVSSPQIEVDEEASLEKREVTDAVAETPVKLLASTYISEEHRIRDPTQLPGHRDLTFFTILQR